MKPWRKILLLLLLALWLTGPAVARNPFTRPEKPEPAAASKPVPASRLIGKMVYWQQQLKQNMTELIRQARSGEATRPLLLLMGLALAYGLLHAAGPGHGKSVATAYVLSHRVSIAGGLLFGGFFALIHGFSGAVAVLGLRFIIQQSVSGTLDTVTHTTQLISFGLIVLLGLGIFFKNLLALRKTPANADESGTETASGKGLLGWAATIGLIPCPAVVMVMLFCLSMEVLLLGLLLAACISLGMAITISGVVIAVILGKTGVLQLVSPKHTRKIENTIGLFSGAAIAAFGSLFLITSIGIY